MRQYSTLSGRCVSQNQASGNGPPGDGWMDGREEIFHGSFAPCDDTVLLQLSSYREQSTTLQYCPLCGGAAAPGSTIGAVFRSIK